MTSCNVWGIVGHSRYASYDHKIIKPNQQCSFHENSMYIGVDGKIDPCCMLASQGIWGKCGMIDYAKIVRFNEA